MLNMFQMKSLKKVLQDIKSRYKFDKLTIKFVDELFSLTVENSGELDKKN